MIKVSVMYPDKAGCKFDHSYYANKHMPMVKSKLGNACKSYTVDKGLAGGAPGAPCHLCRHVPHILRFGWEAFQTAFGPNAQSIMADIPNYTDLTPVIQISEVVGRMRESAGGGTTRLIGVLISVRIDPYFHPALTHSYVQYPVHRQLDVTIQCRSDVCGKVGQFEATFNNGDRAVPGGGHRRAGVLSLVVRGRQARALSFLKGDC